MNKCWNCGKTIPTDSLATHSCILKNTEVRQIERLTAEVMRLGVDNKRWVEVVNQHRDALRGLLSAAIDWHDCGNPLCDCRAVAVANARALSGEASDG